MNLIDDLPVGELLKLSAIGFLLSSPNSNTVNCLYLQRAPCHSSNKNSRSLVWVRVRHFRKGGDSRKGEG